MEYNLWLSYLLLLSSHLLPTDNVYHSLISISCSHLYYSFHVMSHLLSLSLSLVLVSSLTSYCTNTKSLYSYHAYLKRDTRIIVSLRSLMSVACGVASCSVPSVLRAHIPSSLLHLALGVTAVGTSLASRSVHAHAYTCTRTLIF